MNRRGFLAGILKAGVAPALITGGVLMPVSVIAAPSQQPIALPKSRQLVLPGEVEVIATIKTAIGHRVGLRTLHGSVYVDAVLPGAWWTDPAAKRQVAMRLYSEQCYRA